MTNFLKNNRGNIARLILFAAIMASLPTVADTWRFLKDRNAYIRNAMGAGDLDKVKRYFLLGGQANLPRQTNENMPLFVDPYNSMPQDYEGASLLSSAVYQSRTELAVYLISKGADVNAQDRLKNTPMHYAISDAYRSRIVQILLEAKADPNRRNILGQTPLDRYIPDARTLELLVDGGLRMTANPISLAELQPNLNVDRYVREETVSMIAQKEKELNLADRQGTLDRLLAKAAVLKNDEATLKLLDMGANPNSRLVGGDGCLLIQYLRSRIVSNWNERLYWTPPTKRNPAREGDVVKAFISHGADIKKAVDSKGYSCLHYACILHSKEAVAELLHAGLDPNLKAMDGKTPMQTLNPVEDYLR